MLGHDKVLQDNTSCHNAVVQVIDTETLQVLDLEVLVQFLLGRALRKAPVVKGKGSELGTKRPLEHTLLAAFVQHFLGSEITQELIHIIRCTLSYEKLTRTDIKEGKSAGSLAKMDGSQEVVLLMVQHRIIHGNTGGYQLRDTTLYKGFGKFGIFQLVADSHTLACSNQLGQIGI